MSPFGPFSSGRTSEAPQSALTSLHGDEREKKVFLWKFKGIQLQNISSNKSKFNSVSTMCIIRFSHML